ncbi:hypothetical protein B0H63DRAFT_455699 [Podospora didyma]|uniref:Uncharacterized protein n=1 Tax=Podospora didyma TaxID=330526 RepID=A0AAE0K077_9PEZI|nr:hypothetical protein B0H63DRAFT_455699 [Podospora didyma]
MSDFRLHMLRRHHILAAEAKNSYDEEAFFFERAKRVKKINCIDDSDRFDLRWLWLMETHVQESRTSVLKKKLVADFQLGILLAIIYSLFHTYILSVLKAKDAPLGFGEESIVDDCCCW